MVGPSFKRGKAMIRIIPKVDKAVAEIIFPVSFSFKKITAAKMVKIGIAMVITEALMARVR